MEFSSEIITSLSGIAIPFLSLCSSCASAFAAYQAYKISRNSYVSEIHKQFLELNMSFDYKKRDDPDYLNLFWLGRMCDFFEYISYEYSKGKLKKDDMSLFREVMLQDALIEFVEEKNEENPEVFKSYRYWLKNQKKHR